MGTLLTCQDEYDERNDGPPRADVFDVEDDFIQHNEVCPSARCLLSLMRDHGRRACRWSSFGCKRVSNRCFTEQVAEYFQF